MQIGPGSKWIKTLRGWAQVPSIKASYYSTLGDSWLFVAIGFWQTIGVTLFFNTCPKTFYNV